jgi:hypothetical protein
MLWISDQPKPWDRILPDGTTMNSILDVLLWPVAVFLDAVAGVLCRAETPKMAVRQKIARWALLASTVVFILTIPLSLIGRPPLGIKPPLAVASALLLVFIVAGKLCGDRPKDNNDIDSRYDP